MTAAVAAAAVELPHSLRAVAEGQLISRRERCCHRYDTFLYIAAEGHGQPIERVSLAADAAECGRRCASAGKRCSFYSYDSESRCHLCSRCELRPPSFAESEEGRRRFISILERHRGKQLQTADRLPTRPTIASSWHARPQGLCRPGLSLKRSSVFASILTRQSTRPPSMER